MDCKIIQAGRDSYRPGRADEAQGVLVAFRAACKWSMLLSGNYRCIAPHDPQSIREAAHPDADAKLASCAAP
jgi:hypothetical protein